MHGVKPDMLVYDPFMGIGTTALACIKLGVNYMGTEIDADYIKVALEYIEKRKSEMTSDNWSLEDNNNNNNDILVVDKKTPKEV